LAYIKKNCWNLDEPSVTFPGTQKSRARRSEASIYFCFSVTTSSSNSSRSLRLEVKAFCVYVAEPASGPTPDHAEFAGCGPTTTSYEHGGVSVEGGLARSLAFSFGRG